MTALLDRDVELAELSRRLAGARAGSGRVIVVEGPAGIGKSTLLRLSAPPRWRTASRRCGPAAARWSSTPPGGWPASCSSRCAASPDWDELTIGAARLAERVLAAEAEQPVLAGDAMHAAVRGLVWLASNLGERGATVLVVDDVHWADAPSLRWLALLARSLAELRIGVVCAVRSGEPAAVPELLADLLASAPEPPVRPRPLGPAATQTLVRARLPAATAGFAHACHAVTGGNPFLLGALLTQLTADACRAGRRGRARGSGRSGPSRSPGWWSASSPGCPPVPGSLARAIAVLGSGTTLRHAARLAGLDLGRGGPGRGCAARRRAARGRARA